MTKESKIIGTSSVESVSNNLIMCYFFLFSSLGCIFPLLPLFFKAKNYTHSQIGVLSAFSPLCGFVCGPIWSMYIDSTKKYEQVTLTCHAISALLLTMCYFINNYKLMVIFAILVAVSRSPVCNQLDSHCIEIIPDKSRYGEFRYMGAIAYGLFSFVGGILMGEGRDFSNMFFEYGTLSICAYYSLSLVNLDEKTTLIDSNQDVKESENGIKNEHENDINNGSEKEKEKINENRRRKRSSSPHDSITSKLYQTLMKTDVLTFFLIMLVAGIAYGVVENFLFIRLSEIGGHGILLGIARLIMCISEVPFFIWGGYIQKIVGVWRALFLTQLVFILRNAYYAYLINPWWVLPMETAHGMTFAMMWSTSVNYANTISCDGIETTIQAILASVHFGIGSSIGMTLGGFVYDKYGGRILFQMNAVFCTVSLGLTVLAIILKFYDPMNENINGHTIHNKNSIGFMIQSKMVRKDTDGVELQYSPLSSKEQECERDEV